MSLDIRPNPSATGSVTGGLEYKGSYNATTNSPDLTSSEKGDFYIVSVGGTLAGITLDVGDHIVFNQDAASPITSAMFDKIDNTDAVASVNAQTGVVVLDTDDIAEGTTNLYYTNARFDTQLGTKDTGDLSEGSNLYYTNGRADARIGAANLTDLNDVNYTAGASINGYVLEYVHANTRWEAKEASGAVSSVNTQTGAVVLDTDNIAEGSSNLYYTNARFDTQLGTKDTDNLSEGSSNLYYTNARFDTQLGTKDTGDLSEGSNLYYTNGRADARIGAANLTDLNDVNYTAGASINGYVLEYVHANTRWEAKEASGAVSSVNTQTGAVVLDTDNIAEGSSNLYYTNARFDTQLGTKDTDNLSEGSSNLYYTNARFDTQLGTKDTGDLSEGSNLYYTNGRADARIGAANLTDLNDVNYTAGAGIDNYVLTYNHANTRWEAEAAASGGGTRPTVTSITAASYTIGTTDSTIGASELERIYTCSSSAATVNLPSSSGLTGLKLQIKNLLSSTITIDPNGTEQIDSGGAGTAITLDVQFESVTLCSDGTGWIII
jgi:hypothetical protein